MPASYNNIVGLKPTLGLLSRVDMVNASMHFDTVSISHLQHLTPKKYSRYVKPSMIEMFTGARTQQNPL